MDQVPEQRTSQSVDAQFARAFWWGIPMAPCLFEIGQLVHYRPEQLHPNARASGTYTIVGTLPDDNTGHQYRIRSDAEAFDRIAKERELTLAQP